MKYKHGRFVPGAFTSLAGVGRLLHVEDTLHFEHSHAFLRSPSHKEKGGIVRTL
jgi:hypothetical protein